MKKTTALCLFLCTTAFGQQVQITDKSPSGSPVSFQGTITFSATAPNCTITAHNNSSRIIVALGVQINVVTPAGHPFYAVFAGYDHFFASDETLAMMGPKPEQDFNPEFNCSLFTDDPRDHYPPQSPSMTITATVIQFFDGSVWGDAREVMVQRRAAIAYLQSLKSAPDLTQALAQEPPLSDSTDPHHTLSTRDLTWAILRDEPTPQAQADEVNRRLAIAQKRGAWITD